MSPLAWLFGSRSNMTNRVSNNRRIELLKSYAPDWILTIVLAAVFFALSPIHGFRRQFSVDDETIRFPYAVHERVPDVALYFIAIMAPLVIQFAVSLITVRSFWDYHHSALGLILGLAITGAFTQLSKITVGRPRPDLLSRCIPTPGSQDPVYGLSTDAICTQIDLSIIDDGWRSFPSGHSSLSFAGLGFLSFYLAGKIHLFDDRGHTYKVWISVTPLASATLVAISRTMDYRHHWEDVAAGAFLGFFVAYFTYRQYFPSLTSPMSHLPYPPRVPSDESVLPTTTQAAQHSWELSDDSVPEPGSANNMRRKGENRPGNESIA